MKKFNFERPDTTLSQQHNWEQLNNATATGEYDPFTGTTPLTKGFVNVDLYWGTYHKSGPLCHFNIILKTNTILSWSAGSTIYLPFAVAARGGSSSLTQEPGKAFPATSDEVVPSTDIHDWFSISGTDRQITAAAGSAGVSGAYVCISGWYFI